MIQRQLLTILYFLVAVVTGTAQVAHSVQTFTVRDGLPANAITSVKQDSRGLIWIATWNGLCCYDGNQFITFRGEPWGSDNALSSYRIAAIEPDSEGHVWVMTYDRSLYHFDTERCQFFNVGLAVQRKYGREFTPRHIYALPNGHTWISDEQGQTNLRISDKHPTDVDRMEVWGGKERPVAGSFIRKVETDRQGREWIITDRGMQQYGSKVFRQGVFTNYPDGQPVAPHQRKAAAYVREHGIGKHCIDRQGNLWYTSSHGLLLVTFHNNPMRLLPIADADEARSLLCRRDGTVWVGTKGGLLAMYDADGRLSGTRSYAPYIYALMEDRQGNVWIGTKGSGLYVVGPAGNVLGHYEHHDGDTYSLAHNYVYDIDQDEQGRVWIATWGGGVCMVDGPDVQHLRFLHRGNTLKRYPREDFDMVRRITHDGRGNMLASTTGGQLTWGTPSARPADIRFYTTRHNRSDTTSLWANDVVQTLVASDGRIYVATMGGGIQQLTSTRLLADNLKLRIVGKMNQGAGNALSMTEDRRGNIWITRESEVNRYVPQQTAAKADQIERFAPYGQAASAELTEAKTIITPDGHLWAGAVGGVLTFDTQQLRKSSYQPNMVFSCIQFQGEQVEHPLLNRLTLNIETRQQRNMMIRFAALDYGDNYLMQYAYQLLDTDTPDRIDDGAWNYLGSNPRLTFNELSPGRHTLIVRSTNADGVWVDNATALTIYVRPMLVERLWFRLLLTVLAAALFVFALIRYLRYRQQNRERERRLERIMNQYRALQEEMDSRQLSAPKSAPASYSLPEPEIADPDKDMMNRLMAFIEQHLADEALRIEDMADAVGLGRTVFYHKIKELLGVSPSDFLKQVRMERAEQLVAKSRQTFSEIAYNVGFNDPKYFTKCFKKQTGMTPSEYRNAKQKESATPS